MKKIIISPWSKIPRSGIHCAKNYPYWKELVSILSKKYEIIQVGTGNEEKIPGCDYKFNLPMAELKKLLDSCDHWISVDNFFHHFAHYYKRYGTVIFAKSNPSIFGYKENNNILKDKKYLRNDQFDLWDKEQLDKESFPKPEEIANSVISLVG